MFSKKNLQLYVTKILIIVFSVSISFVSATEIGEGWKYHNGLNLKIIYDDVEKVHNLSPCHTEMADILSSAQKDSKEKYMCLFRFTPIKIGMGNIEVKEDILQK